MRICGPTQIKICLNCTHVNYKLHLYALVLPPLGAYVINGSPLFISYILHTHDGQNIKLTTMTADKVLFCLPPCNGPLKPRSLSPLVSSITASLGRLCIFINSWSQNSLIGSILGL